MTVLGLASKAGMSLADMAGSEKTVARVDSVAAKPPATPPADQAAWDSYYGNLIPRYDVEQPVTAAASAAAMADAMLVERRKRQTQLTDPQELGAWDNYYANVAPKFDVNRPSVAASDGAEVADAMIRQRRARQL